MVFSKGCSFPNKKATRSGWLDFKIFRVLLFSNGEVFLFFDHGFFLRPWKALYFSNHASQPSPAAMHGLKIFVDRRVPINPGIGLEGVEKPSPSMTAVSQALLPVTGYARVAPPPSAVKDFAFGFGFDFSG
jgi:hypothetical protein